MGWVCTLTKEEEYEDAGAKEEEEYAADGNNKECVRSCFYFLILQSYLATCLRATITIQSPQSFTEEDADAEEEEGGGR